MPGLDDNHMIIGVGLRIMGNFFRVIRIIIKRLIGKLLDDNWQFLIEKTTKQPHGFYILKKVKKGQSEFRTWAIKQI